MIVKKGFHKIKRKLVRVFDRPLRGMNRVLDAHRLGSLDRFAPEYFAMRREGTWGADTRQVAETLYRRYRPASVVDYGCGNGVYLEILRSLGVEKVKGYDGSPTAVENASLPEVELADLRDRIDPKCKFDMVLCIEVAPYLHEKYEDYLIENLAVAAAEDAVIIFAASDSYQGGIHHVNVKGQRHWMAKFADNGFDFREEETEAIKQELELNTLFWIKDDIMVFRRRSQ